MFPMFSVAFSQRVGSSISARAMTSSIFAIIIFAYSSAGMPVSLERAMILSSTSV